MEDTLLDFYLDHADNLKKGPLKNDVLMLLEQANPRRCAVDGARDARVVCRLPVPRCQGAKGKVAVAGRWRLLNQTNFYYTVGDD